MGFLQRWRPVTDLDHFRNEFDELLEHLGMDWSPRFGRDFFTAPAKVGRPAIESYIKDGTFVVRADLPGIDPKNVDIKVVGDVLTIKGFREEKSETTKTDYLRRE